MSRHTILVVEDNPATRRMVGVVLGNRGHRVLAAPDARTALDLAERHQPVVVLQDLVLPDFDGFALVGELRKRSKGAMAVLAFTGFTSHSDEARISAVGFDDVIMKPIEPSRLVPIVEAHLPAPSLQADRFGAGRRLVIADDDPIQLKLTRFHLERLGFSVDVARDGREALMLAERSSPDAIVSDVLMPNLDGFGLALAVRRTPTLEHLPVLLVTSSYVDDSDRDLARRAGANDLLLRTPEHREVVQALRRTFAAPWMPITVPSEDLSGIESERTRRLVQQLERHVLMNSGLARRASALAAELAVLTGISEAVLRHQSVETALDEALASCLDAGGISIGALYLINDDDTLRVRPLARNLSWREGDLESFFGHEPLLRQILTRGAMIKLPSPELPEAEVAEVLRRCAAPAVMLVPLVHAGRPIGALFMAAHARELDQEDWPVFAQAVGNQIAQALAVARAFAQREAAERRARDQERLARDQSELLQLILDQAPDLITRVDRAGVITFVNRALPPRTPAQMLGTPWLSHLATEDRPRLSQALDAVLALGETSTHELMSTEPDGHVEWCSSRIGPVRSDGQITGAVVISRLITKEKEREAQLMVSDRMASIGTLAAGVAHEINNPLAAVIANVDIAYGEAQRAGADLQAECLKDALDAADRVRLIVRDLKVFSGSDQVSTGPVDVRRVLESTVRIAWNEIRHRARMVRDFQPVPLVEGNDARLGQVFLNLMINAAHAIADGRADDNQIRVSTRLEGERVAVEVTDTGAGMPAEVQRRLFTPFFTTKVVGVGTGLGLSICHRIVTGMGGEIRVRSQLGKGSTFTVLLPPSGTAPGATAPSRPGLRAARRRGRVLVIDDDRVVVAAVRRALTMDHEVVDAFSAEDALVIVQGGATFDVILCDLMMPQMTGMELHAALVVSHPEQARRMIFLTGGAFTESASSFLNATPNLAVEKPFDVRWLRGLVNERVE